MPRLKQLDCQIKWAGSTLPLKEHHVSYGDGFVHSYVAVPPIATPFYIQLKSNGFIAPGLAMFVYIDGEYHCNRNRCNLKAMNEATAKHQIEVDFIVRQKEKPVPGGQFVAKQWRFRPDNTGIIEVVVLRCYPAPTSGARKKTETALSAPSTVTSIELSSDDDGTPEPAIDEAQSHGGDQRDSGDLFDGANDSSPTTDIHLHFGEDGSWDAHAQWDTTTAQDQGTLLPAPQNTSIGAQNRNSSPHWAMGNAASRGHSIQPSPAIIINVNQLPAQPAGTFTPRSRMSSGSQSGQGDSQAASGAMIPGPRNTWASNGQNDKETRNGHSQEDADWAAQGALGTMPSEANNNNGGFDKQDQPSDQGWETRNNDPQKSYEGWNNDGEQARGGYNRNGEDNNHDQDVNTNWGNNQAQDSNAGWNDNLGQESSAEWNTKEHNQGDDENFGSDNDQKNQHDNAWANGNDTSQANQGASGGQWDQELSQQGPTGAVDTGHRHPNEAELESPPQHFPPNFHASQPHPAGLSDPVPLPFAINSNATHIKPYWATWNHLPAEREMIFVEEDAISFDSNSNSSEGVRDVRMGSSPACYTHKVGRPEYMDTHDNPYAVFAFSYRPTDVIESMLHVLARETEEEERSRLSVLSKDEILDHFMRAKSMPTSRLPSQGSVWNAQTNAPAINSDAPPASGLGIDLNGVNNRLAGFAIDDPNTTGDLEQGWQNDTEQRPGTGAQPGAQPRSGNGSGGQAVSQQQAGKWGGNATATTNARSNATAGAQEPTSGGSGGTGWGGSQGGGGKAPMMSGALAPQAGQQQVGNDRNGGQTNGMNLGGQGGPGSNAPPVEPASGYGSIVVKVREISP